jgi:hypothetical protein
MKMLLSATLALFLLVQPATAAEDDGCRRCNHRGVVACPEHTAEMLEFESHVQFCSLAAGCSVCQGALLVDCERCKGGPDNHLIAERQTAAAAWLEKDRMSAFLGRPVPHVETERFKLVVDTGTLKDGKKKVDAHKIMHLVADDVEAVSALVTEHYELGDDDYFSKMRMYVWKTPEDHSAVMKEFLLSTSTGDFKLLGKDPVFSVWTERSFRSVPGVRRLFAHNASHMLLSNLYRMLWTGDTGGGFFDAGAGHWYEYKLFDRSVNYCIEEATVPLDYHGGEWRAPIRKRLAKDEARQLPRLLPMNTGALELPDQALCWSFYDWLVAEHPAALAPIQRALKDKRPGRDVLEEVLGMKVLKIEEAWRAWVAAIYPIKGDKPRTPKKKKGHSK